MIDFSSHCLLSLSYFNCPLVYALHEELWNKSQRPPPIADKEMVTDCSLVDRPHDLLFHPPFHRRRHRVPASPANVFPNDTSTRSSLFFLVDVDVEYVGPLASSRIQGKHLIV